MKHDELRTLLANQPDFASVKPELQELVEERGHILLFGPKCHPECMHIEMCWAHVKQYTVGSTVVIVLWLCVKVWSMHCQSSISQ